MHNTELSEKEQQMKFSPIPSKLEIEKAHNCKRELSQEEKEQVSKLLEIPVNDAVNHPAHYCKHPSGVECIDITRHYCFAVGNAIKYLWRAGLKSEQGYENNQKEIEDLEKAIWYIKDRINELREK